MTETTKHFSMLFCMRQSGNAFNVNINNLDSIALFIMHRFGLSCV